jgi:hypothetical protein
MNEIRLMYYGINIWYENFYWQYKLFILSYF